MELIHRKNGGTTTLATDVRLADGFFEQRIGLMGKRPLRVDEALVFRFAEPRPRQIHTLFVRAPIDVIWVKRERVTAVEPIRPWRLGTRAVADTVIELSGGAAANVGVDDVVRIDGH